MKTLTEKRFFEWHEDDVAVTLRNMGGSYGGGSEVLVVEPIAFVDDITIKANEDGVAFSLRSRDFKGGQCVMQNESETGVGFSIQSFGQYKKSDAASCISRRDYKGPTDLVVDGNPATTGALCASGYGKLGTQEAMNGMYVIDNEPAAAGQHEEKEELSVYPINTMVATRGAEEERTTFGVGDADDPQFSLSTAHSHAVAYGVDCRNATENEDGTLQAEEQGQNLNNAGRVGSVVRRLTPEECELLQGFPKGWTDIGDWYDSKGKLHKGDSDTPRYKALGNSICLPFWFWLLRRISAQYERRATMGSLFDGISGFPLCWERVNGIGTARWSSEIEEFPIAVCKKHFGDEENNIAGDIRDWI